MASLIAFIPARGGSKRLPGKNMRDFCGKPLIEWTINFALRSGVFSGVFVSTDDDEIAAVSKKSGADVINRPQELSTDEASTAEAAYHAWVVISKSQPVDFLCTLQPTNPLRPRDLMQQMLPLLSSLGEDTSLMTVTKCKMKFGKVSDKGEYLPVGYSLGQRSQDIDQYYSENGLAYVTPLPLIRSGRIFGDKVHVVTTDDLYDLDIDNIADFRRGEAMLNENREKFSYLL